MARRQSLIDSDDVEAQSRAAAPPEEVPGGFDASDIQRVAPEQMASKAAVEKFMNEFITIEIEPGTEAHDPVFVELGHNGINQFVKRGVEQRVKRKFLYSALMAKKVSVNVAYGKDNSGNEFNRITNAVSTAYRARLVMDSNPQGGPRWVQSVMAESAGAR